MAETGEAGTALALVDLGDVPLSEILALGPEALGRATGRTVPGAASGTGMSAAFQSGP